METLRALESVKHRDGKYAEIQCVLVSCYFLLILLFLLLILSVWLFSQRRILKLSASDRTVKKGYSQLYKSIQATVVADGSGISIIKNDRRNPLIPLHGEH